MNSPYLHERRRLAPRADPPRTVRPPANTARDYQVEAALGMLLEAVLAATAPAERAALYEQVQPTVSQALEYCFPQLGPNGNLKKSKLPPTPLAGNVAVAQNARRDTRRRHCRPKQTRRH